jgi:hypothetical protein
MGSDETNNAVVDRTCGDNANNANTTTNNNDKD